MEREHKRDFACFGHKVRAGGQLVVCLIPSTWLLVPFSSFTNQQIRMFHHLVDEKSLMRFIISFPPAPT